MQEHADSSGKTPADPRLRPRAYAFAALVCATGLIMAHHPMILSGFRRVQVDVGDSRLINYFLEHNFRWYRGDPLHREFWNPPFFYPSTNAAALSDTMLGAAPIYALFRVLGIAPDTSFQFWMIALSLLNYAVMFHLLRKRLSLSIYAASAGAFLFAFGAPRVNMLVQQSQMTQGFSLISIDALFGLFGDRAGTRLRRAGLWLIATAGLLAQLSSGFYTGWFTVLSLGLAVVVAVWMPSTRAAFFETIKRDAPWIALAALLGGLAIRPWVSHHLAASHAIGPRYYPYAMLFLPRPGTWLYLGTNHWLAGPLARATGVEFFKANAQSMPIGVGLVTTLAALLGLGFRGDLRSTRLLTAVALALAICVTVFPLSLIFAIKALLLVGSVTLAYMTRRERPAEFLAVIAIVIALFAFKGFPTETLRGFGLFTLLAACAAWLRWERGSNRGWVLGGLVVALTYSLMPSILVLALAIATGTILAGVAASLGFQSRRQIETAAVVGFLLFAVATTFGERPLVLRTALGALLLAIALSQASWLPGPGLLPRLAAFGLVAEILFYGPTAWHFFYLKVPGACALLFVGRVGLLMLIPLAIGVGHAIDAMLKTNRRALAGCVGLVCLVEQGVTTGSYDKSANRQAISTLSRRIDPKQETFYISPYQTNEFPFKTNLDAMWAGLETGKPTVNGYSGSTPIGWRLLDDSSAWRSPTASELKASMEHWRSHFGQSVKTLQWIGGPVDHP